MSKPTADVGMNVHQQSAIAALQAFESRFVSMMNRMDASVKKQGQSSKTVNKEIAGWSGGIGKAVLGVAGFHSALSGVRTVAGLIKRDIAEAVRLAETAQSSQLGFNETMANIQFKMAPDSDITISQVRQGIIDSKTPNKLAVAQATDELFSAGLTEPFSQRAATAKRVGELLPHLDGPTLASLGTSVMIAQRNYGGTIDSQLGTMLSAASAARTTDMKAFSDNIAALLPVAKQLGITEQTALSQAAALGIASNDPTGPKTRTNLTNMWSQLHEKWQSMGRQEIVGDRMFDELQNLDDKDAAKIRRFMGGHMRSNLTAEERKEMGEMKAGLRQRANSKVIGIDLFNTGDAPEGSFRQLIDSSKKMIAVGNEASTRLHDQIGELNRQPWYQVTLAKQGAEDAKQRADLESPGAMKAQATPEVARMYAQAGQGHVPGMLHKFIADWALASDFSDDQMLTANAAERMFRGRNQMALLRKAGFTPEHEREYIMNTPSEEMTVTKSGWTPKAFRKSIPLEQAIQEMPKHLRELYMNNERQIEVLMDIRQILQQPEEQTLQAPMPPAAAQLGDS